MARNNKDQQQVSNNSTRNSAKERKGDTGRSSDQGRKTASGGSTNTNNRGHKKGV